MTGFLAVAVVACATLAAGAELDPLHLDGTHIRDSSNRVIILRGVVTITGNNDGRPMVMTPADYSRIRAWGFNVQQIRLEACRLGLLPPCQFQPAYLDKLESWVSMAEAKGIYTIFKATTYDVPGLDFLGQFRPGAWDRFWDAKTGYQDQFIAGWKRVWERFKDRPAVVGYDILNECSPGSNTPRFIHSYLFPFYRKAAAELRQIDRRHFFIFQPPLRADDELEPLGGENVVYAPHYYPRTGDAERLYARTIQGGEKVKAPVIIGEYGLPNVPLRLPNFTIPASTAERDRGDALLFDRTAMSTIKTWYTSIGNWALLTPDGAEQPRLEYFSRPFPQRTAGLPKSFSFDFATHEWDFQWQPDASIREPTLIFVPLKRHFPKGFAISSGDSLRLEADRNSPSGLRVVADRERVAAQFRYDFESEILTVGSAQASGARTLRITALSI